MDRNFLRQRATSALLIAVASLASLESHAASPTEAECIETSARYNGLPVSLLRAVRLQEGGVVGGWHRNSDGSFDYGVMQINSRWLPLLATRGYSANVLVYDECASIAAGAWILADAMARRGLWNNQAPDMAVYWRAVGDYHSRTPHLNRAYAERVIQRYRRIVEHE